jgi:hypothetical protein
LAASAPAASFLGRPAEALGGLGAADAATEEGAVEGALCCLGGAGAC